MNLLLAAAAVCVAILLFQCGARRLYGYALTATSFEVRLFGWFPLFRVARRDIVDAAVWRASLTDIAAGFTTLRVGNRISRNAVVITLRGRFPRRIIVTPDEPGELLAKLRATAP